ncbi:non-ribosomal peptide synthetase [Streptomyces tendae]|uniref:non-ribosomal peptide synthetase n=1 Tax=Streptomyces tendae TaxID=1932 RepID=UPI00248F58F3|nr:non-ribosomal peptide synthetase [Streptomyces tendae]
MSIVPRRRTAARSAVAAPVPGDGAGPDRPLSLPQQQLWFMDRVQPGSSLYNLPVILRLQGELDLGVLQRSLRDIVARHEVLRTRFPDRDGVPVQVVMPGAHVPLPVHDVRTAPAHERALLADKLVGEETHAPFDLAEGPGFRATVVRTGATDHILVLTFHHIVFDGSSSGVFLAELTELYTAHLEGRTPELAELHLQYADFAERARGTDLDAQLRYWQERFRDVPPTLQLPTDRPRPAVQSYKGAAVSFELDEPLVDKVERFAGDEGVTPFSVMLSAYYVLLARYTAQHDLAVGIPVLRRAEPDLDPLIGCFVNTLAIRADVPSEITFRDLLAQVAESLYGAFENMEVQFDDVVRVVQPDRDPSHSPLVQASFGMLAAEQTGELVLPGLRVEVLEDERLWSKFDLSLDLIQQGKGYRGEFEYATDLFDRDTIRRAAGHWVRLLEALVDDPAAAIATVPLLTLAEEHRQLREWNDTALPVDRADTMHGLFEAQAARTPDALAVVSADHRLTYAELDRQANQLAHLLIQRGIRAEMPVGVCMERGADTLVAFLGVLKSGGVYVPLDPEYPRERLEYMLEHAAVPLVVSVAATLRGLPPVNSLLLDEDREALRGMPETAPAADVRPENLSCMFYTSGSTGTPKSAMVTHANYVNYFRFWEHTYLAENPMRSHLQMTSFAFDIFVADATRALFSGAKLVVVPHEVVMSPQDLYRLMVEEDVNSAEFITPILAALVDHLEETGEDLSFLDLLVAGSDIWYARDYLRVRALCSPDAQIVAAYGLSETSIDNATLAREEVPEVIEGIVPIGRPTANTQLYVLNERLRPQPVGVPGELYVGGAGVGRGYHRDTRRSAQRYLPDPFSPTPGSRLYRSGDLAKYRPDGVLEILGRIDNQVKVNGFRVELGEIESVMRAHPSVDNAVVVVHTAPGSKEPRLVGYVTFVEGVTPIDLNGHLARLLPAYLVPSVIISLDEMPLNANAKIDRRALPEPTAASGPGGAVQERPRTPVEEILAGIWAEVLGLRTVGRRDNFFALGGSSLMMTQIVSRVRRSLGTELQLRAIYQYPTVGALASELARLGSEGAEGPIGRAEETENGYPASYAQEQLWFLHQLGEVDVSYNVPSVTELRGTLDVDALGSALKALVARHEPLRSVFGWDPKNAVPLRQLVGDGSGFELSRADFSGLDRTTRERMVRELIGADERQPFSLESGPLIRATVVRTEEDRHLLLLNQHHTVTDGWSSGVFNRELSELYAAEVTGRPADIAPLPLRYVDFATWQRQWLAGDDGRRQLRYWREQLAGAPEVMSLPFDRPRGNGPAREGGGVPFTVPAETYSALQEYSRQRGVTLFMTLLAAFDVLLARLTGDAELVVGTPASGRTRAELEQLVGLFTNMLALRTRVGDDPAFGDLLSRVRETALDGYAHQNVPFERVVDEVCVSRDIRFNPVFQVVFSLDDAGGGGLTLAGVETSEARPDYTTAKFDLALMMEQEGGVLGGTFTYGTSVFHRSTIEEFADSWVRLLAQIAADPGRRVSGYEVPRTRGEAEEEPQRPEAGATVGPEASSPAPVTPGSGSDVLLGRVLEAMWAEALTVDSVTPEDDFFLLGGNSLRATQVTFGLANLLDMAVPVRALFEHQTLEAFTAEVRRLAAESGRGEEFEVRLAELAEQL